MTKRSDLTGRKFNRLTAVAFEYARDRRAYWRFRCDCGREVVKPGIQVARASRPVMSCGCAQVDANRATFTTHGKCRTPTYNRYHAARRRCTSPKDAGYASYGGRGITMCERWLASFDNFLADMGEASAGHSIERLDVNGPYSPENCVWLPAEQQAGNKRTTVRVVVEGAEMPLKQFAEREGVSYKALHALVRGRGMDPFDGAARLRARRGKRGPLPKGSTLPRTEHPLRRLNNDL